jgi:hypothetical protein
MLEVPVIVAAAPSVKLPVVENVDFKAPDPKLAVPLTSRRVVGSVVPMPTFPPSAIVILVPPVVVPLEVVTKEILVPLLIVVQGPTASMVIFAWGFPKFVPS